MKREREIIHYTTIRFLILSCLHNAIMLVYITCVLFIIKPWWYIQAIIYIYMRCTYVVYKKYIYIYICIYTSKLLLLTWRKTAIATDKTKQGKTLAITIHKTTQNRYAARAKT